LAASRPGFPVLLTLGRFARPMRRIPGLGWVVGDPATMRRILADRGHFTIIGEGVVGHLWARVLGDWVYGMFDGPGHHALRTTVHDLFTEERAAALVARAAGARLRRATADLTDGVTVDLADLARIVVGRIVADLLGLGWGAADPAGDEPYRKVFEMGLTLGALAARTTATKEVPARTVAEGRALIAPLTASVAAGWRTAQAGTLVGRCRDLGLGRRETEGLAALLLVAGTQTTASAMARTVALLHDTGQQDRLLADPGRIGDAVREGLRVTTPVPVIGRRVTADIEVSGRRMRAGQRVLLLTYTADNAPGGFDLDRVPPPDNRHLWFGAGPHFCLGATVGRAEVSSMLAALVATGRRWRIVERRYARRALIPAYARLRIALAPPSTMDGRISRDGRR
jgi:cytochrome P450